MRPSVALWIVALPVFALVPARPTAGTDCELQRAGAARDGCFDARAARLGDAAACQAIDDPDRRIWCLIKVEPSAEHAARCQEIQKTDLRDACLRLAALRFLDASLCGKLSHPYKQKDCAEQVGYRSDASDACRQLEHRERQSCYERRALAEGNPGLCARIDGYEDQCFEKALPPLVERAAPSADWSACDLAGERRADCIIRLSVKLGSDERCASLTTDLPNPQSARHFSDRCFAAVAESIGRASLCEQIYSAGARDACVMDAAAFALECEAAGRSYEHTRNLCFMRLAPALGDPGLCGAISEEHTARQCREFAERARPCREMQPGRTRDDCTLRRASHEGRPRECARIADPRTQAACRTLADPAPDARACERLDLPYQERCLLRVAIARRDASACGSIADARGRSWCEALLSGQALPPGPCDGIVDPGLRRECESLAQQR